MFNSFLCFSKKYILTKLICIHNNVSLNSNLVFVKKRIYNTNSASAPGSNVITLNFDYKLDGYTPIAITTFFNGNRYCSVYNISFDMMQLQNINTTTQTVNVNSAYIDLIYVKSAIVK